MAKIKVALRQLFLAKGCGLAGSDELRHKFVVDGFEVEMYLGKKPALNIVQRSVECVDYDPNIGSAPMGNFGILPHDQIPEYQNRFFTDILCAKEIEIEDELFNRLNDIATEGKAKNEILEYARKNFGEDYHSVANFCSGMLGLRFHFQFVCEVVNEVFWLYVDKYQGWCIGSLSSARMRMLEPIDLLQPGQNLIKAFGFTDVAKVEALKPYASSLELLRRAWQEHNHVYKFIHLFTSLEIAINIYSKDVTEAPNPTADKIKSLIRENAAKSDLSDMLNYIDSRSKRGKSTRSLFYDLAKSTNFSTCTEDIEAFKEFYIMRNKLFHNGEKSIHHRVTVKNGTQIDFEFLVERYINWVIWGDDQYYDTKYRKKIKLSQISEIANDSL